MLVGFDIHKIYLDVVLHRTLVIESGVDEG